MEIQEKRSSTLTLIALFAVLGVGSFFSNFQRLALGVLADAISIELGLTVTQLAAIGAAIFYPYAALQIPSGIAGDRMSPRKLIMFSCTVTAIGGLIFASATNFTLLIVGRFLTGVGTSFVYVPALAILRREFGDARFGTANGAFMLIGSVGSMCAGAPLRLLSEMTAWRTFFYVSATIELLAAAAALFVIPSAGGKVKIQQRTSPREILSFGFATIWIWFMFTVGTNLAFASLWGNRFYTQALLLSPREASVCLTLIPVGSLAGSLVFGTICDKFGSIRTLVFSTAVYAATWAVFGMLPAGGGTMIPFVVSFVMGASNNGSCIAAFTSVKHFVSPSNTGLATGICNCWNFVGSALLTQLSGLAMEMAPGDIHDQFSVLMWAFALFCGVTTLIVAVVNRKIFTR